MVMDLKKAVKFDLLKQVESIGRVLYFFLLNLLFNFHGSLACMI